MENSTSSTSGQENAFNGVTPEASQPSPIPTEKTPYHVFINHRGCDVKHTLASSIYHTLELVGLRAFLDVEELELADSITVQIQEAMRTAKLHIAIFSVNYAKSPWCLAELSFMVKTGTPIIPVFYNVQPDDLRWVAKKKGIYASAFSRYKENERYSSNMLKEWITALQTVSNLSGYILNSETDDQGRLLKNIADKILGILGETNRRGPSTSEASHRSLVTTDPFGGAGGRRWDDGFYTGIRRIDVRSGRVVDSITVEYDQNGKSIWSERRGGDGGGQPVEVKFDYPNEVLVSISGQFNMFCGSTCVTSITFHTNKESYGPFGDLSGGSNFETARVGCKIIGFHGRSGSLLDAIGVHSVTDHTSG